MFNLDLFLTVSTTRVPLSVLLFVLMFVSLSMPSLFVSLLSTSFSS